MKALRGKRFASALAALTIAASALPGLVALAGSPDFEEHFDTNILNPNLEDADNAFVIEAGSIHRAGTVWERHYVRTIDSDYMSRDFVAEVSLSIGQDILFFGIGPGSPDCENFCEPFPAILMRMHGISDPWMIGQIDAGVFPHSPFDPVAASSFYFLSANGGFHRARITKQGAAITFAFDENYNGAFMPDATYTVTNVLALTPWLNNTNSRIFFGTENTAAFFDDLVVRGIELNITTEPTQLTESSGVASIRVERFRAVDQPASIRYEVTGGTATPGTDFLLTNGVLEFAAGVTNLAIPLTIIDDALVEGLETILLGLTNSANGWSTQVQLTILDDDTGIELESATCSVSEDAGQVVLGVRRHDDSTEPATVDFTTVDGTAQAGEDYVASTGMLTFALGETRKEIVVPIVDDQLREWDKAFTVRLSNVAGGSGLGATVQSTVTIQDDDFGSRNYYYASFDAAVGPEWSEGSTDVTPVGNRRFLGQFGNQTVSLSLANLPEHASVALSFDLFVIQSWDADGNGGGPDVWDLSVAGGQTLLHTTFSNTEPGNPSQAFPGNFPGAQHPARTGAAENNTLGYSIFGDSVYYLSFTFAHTGESLRLEFSGMGLEGIWNESWGLDNVSVALEPPPTNSLYVKTSLAPASTLTLTSNAPIDRVSASGTRAVVLDGVGRVHLLDLGSSANPRLLGTWEPWFPPYDAEVAGNLVYIASYETDFLSTVEIVDFTDPAKPVLRGYYDTPGYAQDLALAGQVVYVADGEGGLLILDVSDPARPRRLGSFDTKRNVSRVQVFGRYAYATDGNWLIILDVSDPANPWRVGLYEAAGAIVSMQAGGGRLYLAETTGDTRILDLSDPRDIKVLGSYRGWGTGPLGMAVSGSLAYLARGDSGLQVIDVSDPSKPAWVTGTDRGQTALDVALAGSRVLVATGDKGLVTYELQRRLYPPLAPPVVAHGLMTLTWPYLEGVRLQKSTNLASATWEDAAGAEGTNTLSLPVTEPAAFFRLMKGPKAPGAVSGTELLLHFDEDNAGSAVDSSGQGRDGQPVGVTVVPGRFGLARRFFGPGTYISIPGTENLNLASGMTLEAWVRFVEPNVDQPLVVKHAWGYGNGYFLGIGNPHLGGGTDGQPAFFVDEDPRLRAPSAVNDGEWHHLAGVYEGLTQYLYVDGQLAGQQDRAYDTFNAQVITIGSYSLALSDFGFRGDLDEVRVINRPLSPTEVAAAAGILGR